MYLCVCVYVYIYIYICIYVCVYIYIYMHVCVYIYIYILWRLVFGKLLGLKSPGNFRVEGLGLIRTVAGEYQRLLSTQPFTLNPKP